jgi:polyisoprenoid-binding protein YceI
LELFHVPKTNHHHRFPLTHPVVMTTNKGSIDTMTATNDKSQVPVASVTTWKIDPEASHVEFIAQLRLMFVMKMPVSGRFPDLAGTLTVDEGEPTSSRASITIGTASVDTKMAGRDKHLRTADFFDVEHYPTMTFTSQQIEALDSAAGHYRVTGMLTIREVTREVSLDTWNVPSQSAGDRRLTFNLTTVLHRRDWGLTWERPMQRIADEVNLALTVQFVPVSPAVE